ncbi:unnamed protein product [Peronospora belbahrii]|uniref:AAA+ ATPase domain-containing protein n=1 Tax=Peronospora belbahrii TaxID=622444 RepID=A0AAU9KLZ4_9STRA|nr:unnamed protein product [Peronospora belbahrii]CAH0517660.1 unnamed protein product [Peronospora belbahrii]
MFWPACVYPSYSDAVAHTHDVWALRNVKPALDAEDRVLYFFGVGPRACHVAVSGSAPNLQLCVVHTDDLLLEDWQRTEDFAVLCSKYQIPEDVVTRTKNNGCFLRACKEAETYVRDVQTDEKAGELFVTLLTMAKKAHTTGKAVVARESIASPDTTPVKVTVKSKKTRKTDVEKKTVDVAKLLKTPAMGSMVAKCWQQMLKLGWETMTQGDGQVLYKMPGTSFFDFVPNVNLFDSLEKACAKYLSDWVKTTTMESDADFSELTEFLWPLAAESGWESMSTTTETLYKKAGTPFDQWVPNVTIFRTKTQAVAKYLEECGLAGSNNGIITKKDKMPAVFDATDSRVQTVKPHQPAEEEPNVSEESDGEDKGDNQNVDKNVSVKKMSVKHALGPKKVRTKGVANKAAPKTQQAQAIVEAPIKQGKLVRKVRQEKKPSKAVPPFEMSFGKLEMELKNRGWYWKDGGLQWLYYQPHCKTKETNTLEPNKDFFRGREQLEAYAHSSGLYDHVHTKLKEDHYKRYASDSEDDVGTDNNIQNHTRAAKTPVRAQVAESKPQLKKALVRRDRSRIQSVSRFRRGRSKSTAHGMTSQTTLAEVKFGEIWRVLSEDGWHYNPGKIEYDYFKPHCATAKDGEAGVDFFQSKDLLVEHLQTSGLWDRTAARVRAEAAMSSSDEDMMNSDNEAVTPLQKRKRDIIMPDCQQGSKKHKDASLFRTPTDGKRCAIVDLTDDDEDKTISPDAAVVKSKESQNHGNGRQPLRSLANSFTPSPGITRMEKHSLVTSNDVEVKPTKDAGPRETIIRSIRKLTSAYIPSNFRHREKEFSEIREFFSDCFKGKINTSLYISGAPGCGKTALLKSTQSDIDELYRECCPKQAGNKPIRCHVNAMALADSSTLFCKLAEALTRKSFSSGNEAFEAIERATARRLKSSKTMILILDEIDTLLKHNGTESDLCRLFELAQRTSHSFVLIGIANQVDFTERHLPMLQQQLPDYSPRVVVFEPYKHQTIEQILIERLGGQSATSKMVSSHGISFLARKIASTTGDIRLAVDTCRRVLQYKLDQVEKENLENPSDDKELERPLPLTDVLRIIKHALESKSASAIRSLPRNLQMILFASTRLLIVTANRAASDGNEVTPLFSVDELYSCYCEVSKDAGVFKPLSQRDFRTALDTIGKEGLIAELELRKHLIKLLFSTSELLQSFRKDPFFSRLL